MNDERVPVTIILGYLGSGKTTLINNILKHIDNKKIAIIENEFGELGIDNDLIETSSKEGIYELSNGCICCTFKAELTGTLGMIAKEKEKYDYLIIETTGVADPSPLLNNFFSNPSVNEHFKLDSVICLVDSKNINKQLNKEFETKKQISFADKLILNKIDLVSIDEIKEIKDKIAKLNPFCEVHETQFSNVNVENILNSNSFSIEKVAEIENKLSNPINFSFNKLDHKTISTIYLHSSKSIDLPKFDFWIRMLLEYMSEDIYRIKGILNIEGSNQKLIFQSVHDQVEWKPFKPWQNKEKRESKIVIIGRDLNEKQLKETFNQTLL